MANVSLYIIILQNRQAITMRCSRLTERGGVGEEVGQEDAALLKDKSENKTTASTYSLIVSSRQLAQGGRQRLYRTPCI